MFGKKPTASTPDIGKKKKPIYKKVWFWLLVVVFLSVIFGGNESTPETQTQDEITQAEEATQETNQETTVPEENADGSAPDESVKEDARKKDLEIYSAVLSAETKYKGMISALDANQLELYNACKDTKRFAQTCWGRVDDQEDDLNADYVQACKYYFVQIKSICDDIMDYIDNQKMEDLSNAQEGVEGLNAHILNIVSTRMSYLADAGFTEDEITQILSE